MACLASEKTKSRRCVTSRFALVIASGMIGVYGLSVPSPVMVDGGTGFVQGFKMPSMEVHPVQIPAKMESTATLRCAL